MRKKRKRKRDGFDGIVMPYTVIVDTREQTPWMFRGFQADVKQKHVDILVPTKRAMLRTGDYSIEGLENDITVERKSLSDAYSTFGEGRELWYGKMERMEAMKSAFVVIEADWSSILSYVPPESKSGRQFTRKHFYRSIISWQHRYPSIHWWPCKTVHFAERTCFRILNRYWELIHE